MKTAFQALTDAELRGMPLNTDKLLLAYAELRDHHVTETAALAKRDRSAILRMAGNIACGIYAGPQYTAVEVAKKAVEIARAIISTVDQDQEPVPRPLVGISVLVMKHGKLLLGKRKGSHGAGEYASPGGHLEHLESFQTCAAREVMEKTGIAIGSLRCLRVLNAMQYAPKHYIDFAFVAEWQAGEPEVREPDKAESWDWYALDALPSPLFAMLPSAIDAVIAGKCLDPL